MLDNINLSHKKHQINKLLKNKTKPVTIGLIYSKSCIHCIHLKPIWHEMKKKIEKKVKSGKYKNPEFVEIEHDKIHELVEFNKNKMNEMGGQQVIAEGYPTCFKVESGVIEYYKGNREANEMENWYMKHSHNKKIISKSQKNNRRMRNKTIRIRK